MCQRRNRGFTLVELLVVIGIIALLISILLPALGRARQNAQKAACLSNLHNMGVAVAMYVNQNKGTLPFGTNAVLVDGNTLQLQTWGGLLSVQMGLAKEPTPTAAGDASTNKARGIFVCPDAFLPQSTATMRYVQNTYSVHPNLMPEMVSATDNTMKLLWPDLKAFGSGRNKQRFPAKVQKIPSAGDVILMWDGTQAVPNGNAAAVSFALDHRQLGGAGSPLEYNNTAYANNNGVNMGGSIDGGVNKDSPDGNSNDLIWGNIRWRHMGNTQAYFLYVDGHCAAQTYKKTGTAPGNSTTVTRRNACVPPPG